jgi:hypothetical protein
MPGALEFKTVTIILMAPIMLLAPAICILNIAKSTPIPACPRLALNDGYSVQPVPVPSSVKKLANNKNQELANNQTLKLFNRGNAMSGAPTSAGKKKLESAPISTGITKRKIITSPCAVVTLL